MRRSKPRTSEIIARLVEIGSQRLAEDAAVEPGMARAVMREVAHTLCCEYGGNEIYVPKDLELPRDKRDEEIWRRFSGDNTWALAAEFGLTERQIRYICAAMRKRARALNQATLPGFEEAP